MKDIYLIHKICIYFSILVIICFFIYFNFFNSSNNSEIFIKNLIETNTPIRIREGNNLGDYINDYDIIVYNKNFYDKLLTLGELGLGESYMDGDWDSKNLEETLYKLQENEQKLKNEIMKNSLTALFLNIKEKIIDYLPNNTLESVKNNVSHHYDIGNNLYEKMLDKNMQYTCAYFHKPNMTLDEAQEAKIELVAKKLNFQQGDKVLDIGCGFGSAASYFAEKFGVNVVGVTLSKEQIKYHKEHFANPNVEIRYQDYREVTGKFDKIYSIGVLEQVGRKNYKEYYDKCYELLNDNGVMLIHTIGTIDRFHSGPGGWMDKYIFPEGQLPHLSNLTNEYSDKWYLQDFQNIGLSYVKTLRAWRKNIGNWKGLDNYDERFRRMWEFYLLSCASCFNIRHIHLYQLVYFKNTTTRDDDAYYIRN